MGDEDSNHLCRGRVRCLFIWVLSEYRYELIYLYLKKWVKYGSKLPYLYKL